MRSFIKKQIIVAGIAWLSLSACGASARADDKYYVVFFTFEGTPNLPRLAHTFATFVKVNENADSEKKVAATQTISWLPATLTVRMFFTGPEPGVNLDLAKTLELAKSRGNRVVAWGPYQIRKDLYDRAAAQVKRLNSGAVAYKAMDVLGRGNGVSNCFHAISDIAQGPLLNTGTAFGQPATVMVRDHLASYFLNGKTTHRWLIETMALDKQAVTFRD